MATADYNPGIRKAAEPRAEAAYPAAGETDVAVDTPRGTRGDLITGGPVWGGFIVALASWIMLEILLVAVGLAGIGAGVDPNPNLSAWWWSLIAAAIALFLGGLTAGAASRWRGIGGGVLLGAAVWALTVVALLILSAIGAGLGFGAFGQVLATGRAAAGGVTLPPAVMDTAQNAAWIALLVLAVTLAAAVAGGAAAVKMWPRRQKAE